MDNIKDYKNENSKLMKDFLESTFFYNWRNTTKDQDFPLSNYSSLELALDPTCDLNCSYCFPAGTKILLQDYTNKNIEDIEVGNEILTIDEYPQLKYKQRKTKISKVLNIGKRDVEELIYIKTKIGLEIETTCDHPILSGRGKNGSWKKASSYKIGDKIRIIKNHINENRDFESFNFMVGYFIGVMAGDGSCNKYIQKNKWDLYKIRLAVRDLEPIDRTEKYSKVIGIDFYRKNFKLMNCDALFANKKEVYEKILELIKFNLSKNLNIDYSKGFLSGIYDSEGHISKNGMIRISNTDPIIINEISRCLKMIDIPYIIESKKITKINRKKSYNVRILSPKNNDNFIKFIILTNPSIKRKGIINFINKPLTFSDYVVDVKKIKKYTCVYNIETESHTYIANYFCVHNCYYHNNGKNLYQGELPEEERLLKNTEKIMNFLYKNKMCLDLELFAGELFKLPYIWKLMDIIYDFQKKTEEKYRIKHITIPTNMSFLKNNEESHKKVKDLIKKFDEINIRISISASVDGPFMDYINRPNKLNESNYTKQFYENLKNEISESMYGVHPMIHNVNIEYWIDNFLWFMMPQGLNHIYLLEVRNAQWSEEQAKSLYYFLRFLINYIYKIVGFDRDKFIKAFEKLRGFNILSHMTSRIGRGMGCSLQSCLHIQVDSLNLSPCHRTSYKNFITGKFEFNDDGSYEFNAENIEVYLAEQAICTDKMTPCDTCAINQFCTGACIGANFESTGDLFTIPPTLCRMFHMKYAGIIMGLKDIQMLDYFKNNVMYDKKRFSQIENIEKIMENKNNG